MYSSLPGRNLQSCSETENTWTLTDLSRRLRSSPQPVCLQNSERPNTEINAKQTPEYRFPCKLTPDNVQLTPTKTCLQAKMQISDHRINAVNAKKLPKNRPQKRRCYRRPKLTPDVSLQAGQKTPKFSPVFLPTQTLTPIFHPYILQIFHPYFFSPILFFTHTFFSPILFTNLSPILFSPVLFFHPYFFHPCFLQSFTHTFFTHSFFHPYFLQSFHPYFISPILFSLILFSPIVFTKFSSILLFHPYFSPSF